MTEYDRREFLQKSSGAMAAAILAPGARALAGRAPLARSVTVGLIGLGKQGRAIGTELGTLENIEVRAVCDSYERALKRGQRRVKGASGYTSHREMLEKEKGLEAVIVAIPTHLHAEITIECLKAGKHVYCEAPLASKIEDMKAIVRASRESSSVFQVGHEMRSNPVYQLSRSFYRSGAIRDLTQMRAQSHQKNSWRLPEREGFADRDVNWRLYKDISLGLVGEEGSHQIDTITWFTDQRPVSVYGSGAILLHKDGREVADTVNCLFRYESGAQLAYDATLANSYDGRYEVLHGTMGTFKLAERFGWLFKEADAPIQGWEVYASRQRFHTEEGITLIADATKLAKQGKLKDGIGLPHPPLRYALQDFFASIVESKPPVCTAMDGLVSAAIAAKATEAIRTGAPVAITPDLFEL